MKVAKTTSKAWSLVLVVAAYGIAIVELDADVQLHRFSIRTTLGSSVSGSRWRCSVSQPHPRTPGGCASGRWRGWACSSAAAFR